MTNANSTPKGLMAELQNLRNRLEESEETLRAIGSGEVDAFVLSGPNGDQVFTLKGAEQPYRILVESMNEGAATLAMDGTIVYCNKRLADLLEVSIERLAGTQINSYVAPADRPLFSARFERNAQEHTTVEIAMMTATGITLPALVSCSAHDGGISVVVTDLTQQKRNDSKRRQAEEQIRNAERREYILDRISSCFLTAPDEELYAEVLDVVLNVMESRFGIFGYIADNGDLVIPSMTREVWDACQIPDKTIVFPPASWGKSLWGRAIREKTAFYANEAFRTPEGHIPINNFLTVPIVFGDKTIGLLSVGNKQGGYCDQDQELQELIVSRIAPILNARQQRDRQEQERNRAEESLRVSNTYNRNLIEASLDPLCTIAPDGIIVDVNNAAETITGCRREELIGSCFADYFTDPHKAQQGFQLVMAEGIVRNYPLQIRHRDGQVSSVLYNAALFRDDNGAAHGVCVTARDVTELKKLEAQLFQAQKMEAIGQLAGGIAHDFNNLITGIIGFSSLMEMHMDQDDPQRERLSHVIAAAERGADLTKSLLAFSRKQAINPQPIDLNRIINKTENFLKRIIGEDIDFRVVFHHDALTVHADSGQIEQVLMNLATNARDAMPNGGLFSVETSLIEIDTDFIKTHGYGEAGEYALLSISDNGLGMDETTLKRLFEPFFTTKELGRGTGLGLPIVYGIVKQHNGYINVYSEPGNGTVFTIYLPLLKQVVLQSADHVEDVLTGGAETILVADDNGMVLSLTEKVLKQFGYTVLTAVDGRDAVEKFSADRDTIALVILDVIMPKMNGKEALDEMRKICPGVKALFVSGYTADIIHKRGTLDESLEFLAKPLRPVSLLHKVRDVLDGVKRDGKNGVVV